MARNISYWTTTAFVSRVSLFAGFSYLSGNQRVVEGFAHLGYPQQLRIILVSGKSAWSSCPSVASHADTQGVGLCRIHFCLDISIRRAPSGQRCSDGVRPTLSSGTSQRLVYDSTLKTKMPNKSPNSGRTEMLGKLHLLVLPLFYTVSLWHSGRLL
jgi:hypothetical protein